MEEKIKEIITKTLRLEQGKVTDELSLKNDLCIDSLDLMSIISKIEKEFNITVQLTDLEGIDKVIDVINYVKGKMQ